MVIALRSVESDARIKADNRFKFLGSDTIYGVPLAHFESSKGGRMFWSPEYCGARLQALNRLGLESSEIAKACVALTSELGKPLAAVVIHGRDMQKISLPGCHRSEKDAEK